MSIRVVVVDDHTLVRRGICALLKHESGVVVVGEAGNGREALQVVREVMPDIVLMDISMPEMNGIDATWHIKAELPGVKVLCLSMHTEDDIVSSALEMGAAGYLVKDCSQEELLRALQTVACQRTYISPSVAAQVVERLRARTGDRPVSLLTSREREVLQLLAEGYSTKRIASLLHLSIKTIASHREHLMQKLGIASVAGLTKFAIQHGLTAPTLDS
jgi:DNA-binding NarL/FixJ family response regulator